MIAHLRQIGRGLRAIAHVLGWQFTIACVGVLALLLWAIASHLGGLIAVAVAICALLAIRAHDMGQNPPVVDEDRTEWDAFWADPQWTVAERERIQRNTTTAATFNRLPVPGLDERQAYADWLKARDETALGKPHPPASL